MALQVDVAGTLTSYLELDGANETVDILQAATGSDLTLSGTLTVDTFKGGKSMPF